MPYHSAAMSSRSDLAPHCDSQVWPDLIRQLSVETALVAIGSWMGRRVSQDYSAEDLWQETLLMAWRDRSQHQWIDIGAYRRWLLGIARNRVRDAAASVNAKKRGAGRPRQSLADSTTVDDFPELPPDTLTPSRIAYSRERIESIERSLHSLPEEFRQAVQLRLLEQLPLVDVAAQLDVSLATAKRRVYLGSQLYRARLRDELSHVPGSKKTQDESP